MLVTLPMCFTFIEHLGTTSPIFDNELVTRAWSLQLPTEHLSLWFCLLWQAKLVQIEPTNAGQPGLDQLGKVNQLEFNTGDLDVR